MSFMNHHYKELKKHYKRPSFWVDDSPRYPYVKLLFFLRTGEENHVAVEMDRNDIKLLKEDLDKVLDAIGVEK